MKEKKRGASVSKLTLSPDTFKWVGVTKEDREAWKKAYPAVSLDMEMAKAAEYMKANPSKWKKNWRRYLTNWFNRTQERGGSKGNGGQEGSQYGNFKRGQGEPHRFGPTWKEKASQEFRKRGKHSWTTDEEKQLIQELKKRG